jgi:hypothetical protein
MKKLLLILLVTALFPACGSDAEKVDTNKPVTEEIAATSVADNSKAATNSITSSDITEEMKMCEFKSGIVKYKVEGFGGEGTQVLYFDQFGFRNAISQERVVNGTHITERIILLPDSVYRINAGAGRFFKSPNTDVIDFIEIFNETGNNPATDSLLMLKHGGIYEGIEEIAGKPCKKWSLPKSNSVNWKWKGIILKSEMNMPFGKMIYTVDNMDLDVEVPSMLFDVPRYDYVVQ